MGNLGAYQWMTTAAKKCGGAVPFMGLILSIGASLSAACILGIEAYQDKHHDTKNKENLTEYVVEKNGVSNDGIHFNTGEKFRVLECIKDGVLVDKIDDPDTPYFVPHDFLSSISCYKKY